MLYEVITGIGVDPYEPGLEIPEFSSLEQADGHLTELAERNLFSGVVLIARQGRPDWIRAYGMAAKSRGIVITSSSIHYTKLYDLVLASLEDIKAEDTITIDLHGKTSIGDYMVVTSGRSNRHVGAVADRVLKDLSEHGIRQIRVEGLPHCDWVLIDAGDVIVHVFRPEVRAFYNLEKMWSADDLRRGHIGILIGVELDNVGSFRLKTRLVTF